MNLRERLIAIDALLATTHSVLNRLATKKAVDTDNVHGAIACLTRAREKLANLAEGESSNQN